MGGSGASRAGSVAELTGLVVAPAPEGSVGFARTCSSITGADIAQRCIHDIGGDVFGGGGSVAELTGLVVAPAPEGSVGFGRAGV